MDTKRMEKNAMFQNVFAKGFLFLGGAWFTLLRIDWSRVTWEGWYFIKMFLGGICTMYGGIIFKNKILESKWARFIPFVKKKKRDSEEEANQQKDPE